VEADETYLGGLEEGTRGRGTESKALIVVAAEEDGKGIGRIRMRRIPDASAHSLVSFVEEAVEPGSVVQTDGWLGYEPLQAHGYIHRVTFLRDKQKSPSELLPRVHRVVSLLKRWLLGTHQGAVSIEHLAGYLDEFTFRFNRRKSHSRGKLFYRLVQQAVAVEPATYKAIVRSAQADWS
jgi:transposase-like protein